jgi:hypothetical protein
MQNTLVNVSDRPDMPGKIKGQAELAKNLKGGMKHRRGERLAPEVGAGTAVEPAFEGFDDFRVTKVRGVCQGASSVLVAIPALTDEIGYTKLATIIGCQLIVNLDGEKR